jgi:hypothetical protein
VHQIEDALLHGKPKWEPVPKEKIEAWNTAIRGWTINIALDRKHGHQDGAAARQADGLVVHLTPELVQLAVEQIKKQI